MVRAYCCPSRNTFSVSHSELLPQGELILPAWGVRDDVTSIPVDRQHPEHARYAIIPR